MTTFLSTFVPGFEKLINQQLPSKFPNAKITDLSSGAVLYRSTDSIEKIKQAKFFSNTFLIFKYWPKPISLEELTNESIKELTQQNLPIKASTFRIIYSVNNHMVSLENNLYKKLTAAIDHSFHLKFGGPQADLEFWIIQRNENFSAFGLRLTKGSKEQPGSLSPDLSYLLNHLSNPQKSDVFLDPFAGSGSIPLDRYYHKGFREIHAGDIDDEKVGNMRIRFNKALATRIKLQKMDAPNLPFPDNTIDRIVTDPPWGLFKDLNEEKEAFYDKLLNEFVRVLKKDGILILLVSRDIKFPLRSFQQLARYEILLSGQKASVYQLKRV